MLLPRRLSVCRSQPADCQCIAPVLSPRIQCSTPRAISGVLERSERRTVLEPRRKRPCALSADVCTYEPAKRTDSTHGRKAAASARRAAQPAAPRVVGGILERLE